jgi:hypothetical protein
MADLSPDQLKPCCHQPTLTGQRAVTVVDVSDASALPHQADTAITHGQLTVTPESQLLHTAQKKWITESLQFTCTGLQGLGLIV